MKAPGWLVGLATAVLLGFSGWTATTIVSLASRTAVVEAESDDLKGWLLRIERKLDRVIERR